MLARIAGNGVRCVLVETANRFARDLIAQEIGWRFVQARGIELIAADSPEAFQISGQMRGRVQELAVYSDNKS